MKAVYRHTENGKKTPQTVYSVLSAARRERIPLALASHRLHGRTKISKKGIPDSWSSVNNIIPGV
jgi:hypothetical protein